MRFAILVDNNLENRLCACEHGLSVWLEVGDKCYLLDTGQSGKFADNAMTMGIDLRRADYVVLSHGHYDHSGGLASLRDMGIDAPVIMSPYTLRAKYSVSSVMTKYNGVPQADDVRRMSHLLVDGSMKLSDNVTVFSLPSDAPANEHLMMAQGERLVPDTFADELFVLVTEGSKCALFGGCTHHGLSQVLEYVRSHFGIEHLDAFVGGLHLKGRSTEEIQRNIDVARRYDVSKWVVNHCTGNEAISMWSDVFGSEARDGYTGSSFEV